MGLLIGIQPAQILGVMEPGEAKKRILTFGILVTKKEFMATITLWKIHSMKDVFLAKYVGQKTTTEQ
jgi:hypothetical protein